MIQKIMQDGEEKQFSLSACPFCGKDVALFARCNEVSACGGWRECSSAKYVTVVCSFQRGGCGSSTGFYPTPAEAEAAWNRRA